MKKIKFLLPIITAGALVPMTTAISCSKTTQEEYVIVGSIKYQLDWETQTSKVVDFDKTNNVKQVEIPQTLTVSRKKFTVTEIDSHAFIDAAMIESVNMPDTITAIGDFAFEGCSGLLSIKLSGSLQIIGESAFDSCQNLSSINIPKYVNEIRTCAFYGCTGLTNITVNNENETYSDDGGHNCIIYKEDDENELVCAANNNQFQIPEGITKIGPYACYLHSKIKNITIPSTVKSINECAFKDCVELTTVEFADGSNLASIGNNAFEGCHNLINVEEFPSSLKEISNKAFYDCKKLSTITFNDEISRIGYMAFSETAITEISLPKSVSRIDAAPFANCPNLNKIEVDSENQHYTSQNSDGEECNWIMNKQLNTIYQGCRNAWPESEKIPESITTIYEYAFQGCEFTQITLPSNLNNILLGAFSECTKLTEITLPQSLLRIESVAFENCEKLESVSIPKNVISLGNGVFEGCIALTDIIVSQDNTKYTSQDSDGDECNCIMTEIEDNSGLEIIQGCSATDISSISSLKKIGVEAFYGIFKKAEGETAKYTINLPSSIIEISNHAFAECDGVKEIIFAGRIHDWKLIEKGFNWSLSIPTQVVHCSDGDYPLND